MGVTSPVSPCLKPGEVSGEGNSKGALLTRSPYRGFRVKGIWSPGLAHQSKGCHGLDPDLVSNLGQSPPYHAEHRGW